MIIYSYYTSSEPLMVTPTKHDASLNWGSQNLITITGNWKTETFYKKQLLSRLSLSLSFCVKEATSIPDLGSRLWKEH